MSVIARYYESAQQARNALQSLEQEGVPQRVMALLETPAEGEEVPAASKKAPAVSTSDMVARAMKAGRLLGEHAAFYSSNLKPGQALLVVEAPFGHTVTVKNIMEAHGALDLTHEPPPAPKPPYVPLSRRPAPLSSMLGWQVLSSSPDTYSQFWGFPELSKGLSFLGRWIPTLTRPSFALSSALGMGLLSRNGAPLSSMFGLPVKTGASGDAWTSSFGLPLLTKSSGPVLAAIPQLSRRRWLY